MPRTTENVPLLVCRVTEVGNQGSCRWPLKENQYVIDVQLEPRIAKAALSTLKWILSTTESVAVTLSNLGSDTLR